MHRGQCGGKLDGCVGDIRDPRSFFVAEALDAERDRIGRRGFAGGPAQDGAFDAFLGVFAEQEQHADELSGAGEGPVASLQGTSQLGEGWR